MNKRNYEELQAVTKKQSRADVYLLSAHIAHFKTDDVFCFPVSVYLKRTLLFSHWLCKFPTRDHLHIIKGYIMTAIGNISRSHPTKIWKKFKTNIGITKSVCISVLQALNS